MNHKHAWELIPWYVNGTISESRRDSLQLHLEQCSRCRDEVESQRALMQGMKTRQPVQAMPHASLQKLMARIDAEPAEQPATSARPPRALRWLTAAVVLQALIMGTLAAALLRTRPEAAPAAYQTVSSPAGASGAASVRAVFSPQMSLGELQALLERAHLRIVNGPTPEGVYTLATLDAGDDPGLALLTVRAHPAARFAEPIGR